MYKRQTLEWVTSNGVCPSSRDTLQINVLINLLPIVAGTDQFVCSLSPTLNAIPHAIGTGTWIPLGTAPAVTNPTLATSPVTFTNQGTYTYVWSVGYLTCPTENDTVQITAYLNPSAASAGVDQYICSLNTTLNGNTPAIGTGTWLPLSTEPAVANPTSASTAVTFTSAGVFTYIWSIGNGTCPVENDTIVVTSYAPVTIANAGPDQIICGYTTNFAGNLPTAGTGTWSPLVAATSTISNVLSENSAVNLIGEGLFGFVWTISTGTTCPSSSDTVYIQTYSPPSFANAGPDITSDVLNNLMAANSPTIGVGTWSILNASGNFSNGNDPLSNFTASGDGTYVLVWTITNGVCTAESDTMTLIINPMLIPQVMTPNGDGNNDFFEIRAIADLNGVNLEIYNRWGNVVFKDNDYKNTFKGENNGGEKLADDTYFYLLDIEGKTYKGYFIIKTN